MMYSPGQLAGLDSGGALRARVLQTKSLPPVPHTLLRLLAVIQKEDTSVNELQDIILADQNLTATVLKTANSAYYGYSGKINTVSRAIVALGFQEVQSLCLCALLMQHFDNSKDHHQEQLRLWQHSFTTAGLARLVVSQRPWIKAEEGYVMGLLHDLGRMVMIISFHDEYLEVCKLAKESNTSLYTAEKQYGMLHTMIGKWLAIKWHLPVVIQKIMEYHHDPLNASEYNKEVILVYLANQLANTERINDPSNEDLIKECCKELYISDDDWRLLGKRSIDIHRESMNLVNILK